MTGRPPMNPLFPTRTDKPSTASRVCWGLGGAFLAAFGVFEMVKHGGGAWVTGLAGAIGPDLALLLGITAKGLAPRQLSPKAVAAYNATHHWLPPTAVLVWFTVVPETNVQAATGFTLGLTWLAHIGLDRAAGYWPRARDGFQRWESASAAAPQRA
ncbi:DUF4260 family protein [Actinokineospora sp. G85]|uniref:DUF4260 family protein n=1 Tax=Actinokineospora sp. G85 TaxID=3406626 RepID=UPI003C787928